ncbi:MAG: MBL fold metallo-hydrolase [Balneolaceae bacterium]|nr:MBL fold metallo-hydrolase [Balneolaceae bacterium]
MRVTFLGTGTSMGVPVAGGFGSEFISSDPRDKRTRCSLWVQTEKTSLLIDAGPEFRLQTLASGLSSIDALLVTHEHMDHVTGIDDLRSFNYDAGSSIPCFSSERILHSIQHRFDYLFGSDRYPGSTHLACKVVEKPFELGDATITPIPILHGSLPILGYRINDLVYLTDISGLPETSRPLVEGANVLILGALRWGDSHPSHFTMEQAVEFVESLDVSETYFIHMNGSVDTQKSHDSLPENIRLAHDQQVLWVQ